MIWRVFKRSPRRSAQDAAWWRRAEEAADAGTTEQIAALRAEIDPAAPVDETELREEMIDGLEDLASLAACSSLPVIETQHRVIGGDACHLAIPATFQGETAVPGKLFLTERRVVFAGGRARTWPWHRVRGITRQGRTVTVVVAGPADAVPLLCNTYGDAMRVCHIARRLTGRTGANGGP